MSSKGYPVGTRVIFTGTLWKSADGTAGPGASFSNYECYISRIVSDKNPFPVLLGDEYTNQLGWVRWADITLAPGA